MSTDPDERPDGPEAFGIDHPTVVPENLRRRSGTGPDGEA